MILIVVKINGGSIGLLSLPLLRQSTLLGTLLKFYICQENGSLEMLLVKISRRNNTLIFSLIVHKSLIQENGDPIVEIDGNEKQLGKTTVGDYFHYSAFSLDNDWLITPSTQEKQVLISVDGGGQYQLIYNIQVE